MNRVITLVLSLFGSGLVAVGCIDQRPVGPLRDGPAECKELVLLCKEPAERLGEPYRNCYETGLEKVGNACLPIYYDCVDQCREAAEQLGAAGQGGQGGQGGQSGQGGSEP